jgi:hypothetical protein
VVYTPDKSPHRVRLGLIVVLCQLIDQGGPGRAGFHHAVHGAAAGSPLAVVSFGREEGEGGDRWIPADGPD